MVKKLLVFSAIAVLVLAALVIWQAPEQLSAQTGTALSGYAWEGDKINPSDPDEPMGGMGWISFDGVTLESDGRLTGYAWANPYDEVAPTDNIGWLRFDPPGPYPANPQNSAKIEGSTATGWARFCAGAADPVNCSGGTNPNSGGWDGWVKMSGSGYGIKALVSPTESDKSSSFAWGGNDVVGWIRFIIDLRDDSCEGDDCDDGCVEGPGVVCEDDPGGGDSLSVSCSGTPNTSVSKRISWSAIAQNGNSYSFEWTGSDGLTGMTGANVQVDYPTIGPKNASVEVTDDQSRTKTATCSATAVDIIPPERCDPLVDPTCEGTLGIVPGYGHIEIRTQPLNQSAATVVTGMSGSGSLAAQLRATGGPVSNVKVMSIVSDADGSSPLNDLLGQYPGLQLTCQLQAGAYSLSGSWEPCGSVTSIDLSDGQIAYFRLKVNLPLESVNLLDPFKIQIGNSNTNQTIIFNYKVATFQPI